MILRVKDVCKSKGVSVTDLAARMGIAQESLSRAINGNPTLQTLERIAGALGVLVSELIDEPKPGNFICPNCGAVLKLSAEVEEK
jgi:transcriptional regulator with XRE-family HTH domain